MTKRNRKEQQTHLNKIQTHREKKAKKEAARRLSDSIAEGGFRMSETPCDKIYKAMGYRLDENTRALQMASVLVKSGARCATPSFGPALNNLLLCQERWLRPLEDWVPKGKSKGAQFRGLVDHLLVRYPVPHFLYACWDVPRIDFVNGIPPRNTHFGWGEVFMQLASGAKRHKVVPEILGVPMTRKMVNTFLDAKVGTDLLSALRWAQVFHFTGNLAWARSLHRAIMGTIFGRAKTTQGGGEAFASEVLHWFARQPMMDAAQVGPCLDFILNQKERDRSWSLKGRNANSLGRDVERWHDALAAVRKVKAHNFEPSGFQGYYKVVPAPESNDRNDRWIVTIEEVLSTTALADEGRAMKHCVYSYGKSILYGHTSIWSLRRRLARLETRWDEAKREEYTVLVPSTGDPERMVTIEVSNRTKQIVQQRGKLNRPTKPSESKFINDWAAQAGLSFGRWCC